jgi:hypothetical protein
MSHALIGSALAATCVTGQYERMEISCADSTEKARAQATTPVCTCGGESFDQG